MNTEKQKQLAVFFKKWEGGLSKDKHDTASSYVCPTAHKGVNGYHTNKGITYTTWVSFFGTKKDAEFFAMSDENWFTIFEKGYWIPMKKVTENELMLCVLSSWAWGSGVVGAFKHLQRFIGVTADGIIGNQTRTAFNKRFDSLGEKAMAFAMAEDRERQFRAMKTFPVHGKGWLNRLSEFKKVIIN